MIKLARDSIKIINNPKNPKRHEIGFMGKFCIDNFEIGKKKSKGSSGHIKITVCLIHRANSFEKLEITSA